MYKIIFKIILLFILLYINNISQDNPKKFSTSPCPTKGYAKINLVDTKMGHTHSTAIMQVFNLQGELVKEIPVSVFGYGPGIGISNSFDVSDLPSGQYILSIKYNITYISKLILQK